MSNTAAPEITSEPRRGGISRTAVGLLAGSGLLVLLIIVVWLAGWFGKGRGDAAAKVARQPPPAELKLDLATPLDRAVAPADLSLQDSLVAVAAGVDAKAKLLDDTSQFVSKPSDWGDPRKADEKHLASRNWELAFLKGITKEKYAQQLDFFGVELAVVMPNNKLVYVRKFSQAKPEKHTGPADQEKRFYLTWRSGDLGRADAELLEGAGVSPGDRVVLKILPTDVEAKLAELERDHAGDDWANVSETKFGIRPVGKGYEFYVVEQYRKEQAQK